MYNRLDRPERARRLSVKVENVDQRWQEIEQWDREEPFGGADGDPFVVRLKEPLLVRKIRLQLKSREYLHLDRVELQGFV